MKLQLFFLRHAEAEDGQGKSDFERPLSPRGILQAEQRSTDFANSLKLSSNSLLIYSSAVRAASTAHILQQHIGLPAEQLLQIPEIYEASYQELMSIICAQAPHITELILVGHNPGLSYLVQYLTDYPLSLGTAQMAILEVEAGLSLPMLSAGTASLKRVIG